METPDSLYAKMEKPSYFSFFFLNWQELGQNEHHHVNHFKLWEHQKQNCDQSGFFFICVQISNIEEPPGTFEI